MSELPPSLVALSQATSDDEKRHAIRVATAVVALAGQARHDILRGALVAAAVAAAVEIVAALVLWRPPDRHFGAAITLCVVFPLAARLVRRLRFARLRRRYSRGSFDEAWRALAPAMTAAWERASPGQRAALVRIAKTSS